MKTLSILTAIATAALLRGDVSKTDQMKIQGSWRVVESHHNGKPHPDTKNALFVFAGDKLTLTLFEGDKEEKKRPIPFKLDPSKSPKWFDFGPDLGVYSLERDTLAICFGDTRIEGRTTKFESVPNTSAYLFKLKRENP